MALGKIKADTLEHSTAGSLDTSYVVNGSAKAWANIDGSGTVAIRDSLNTSGLTDEGTGDYTTAFSTSFGNENYSFTYCGGQSGAETTYQMDTATMVVGTHRVQLKNGAGSATDRDYICGTFHGDLA